MTLDQDVDVDEMECREVPQLAYHSICATHKQPLEKCSNERLRRIMDMKEPAKKRTDPMSMSETEAEIARIIQRHRDFFVAMAGLDAGQTDYSLRNDLLRIVELTSANANANKVDDACLVSPPGHKNERGSGFSSPIVAAVTTQAPIPSIASMPTIPAAPPPMYKGWINFSKRFKQGDARAKLTQIGVKVGEKVDSDTFTDCEASAEAMAKLDACFGDFIWGLEPVQPPTTAPAPEQQRTVHRGWISPRGMIFTSEMMSVTQARQRLVDIGIKVGEWVGGTFVNCEVPPEAFPELDKLAGVFIWELNPFHPPPTDSFLRFLWDNCPGDDAHDGLGEEKPLLERCGMCRSIYEAHLKAVKEAGEAKNV